MTNPFRFQDPGPFLHWISLARPAAGGTTDPATGKFVPGGPATALLTPDLAGEPNGDCQDQRKTIRHGNEGEPTLEAEATVYLRDEAVVATVEPGDTGTVVGEEFGSTPHDFEVVGTQLIDGSIFVNWL